jgi:hypothetical protein
MKTLKTPETVPSEIFGWTLGLLFPLLLYFEKKTSFLFGTEELPSLD